MSTLEAQIVRALADGPEACVSLAIALARPFVAPAKHAKPAERATPPLPAPGPLARFFDALEARTVGVQDRLVAPSDWTLDDGKLRFAEENQNVCAWACDPSGVDPRVYYRHHRMKEWRDEHIELSAFLLRFALTETILGAETVESAPCLPDDAFAALLERMRPLPFADASWPESPTRFHAREDALALVSPNGQGVSSVWIGASSREALAFLDDLIDGDWD